MGKEELLREVITLVTLVLKFLESFYIAPGQGYLQ